MSTATNGPRRQLSVEQARERLPALVQDVALYGPVELTEGGKAVAVIVPLDEYRRLAGDRPSTWAAYERFRAEVNLKELGIDASFLDGVRDRSPGRDVDL
jgi:prevent-host-death family protein